MQRALIALALLASLGCSETEDRSLGSDVVDAGLVPVFPRACERVIGRILEAYDSGIFDPRQVTVLCLLQPLDSRCPFRELAQENEADYRQCLVQFQSTLDPEDLGIRRVPP